MTARHEFGDSFTGMLCGTMVALPDGSGDECGLPATDPIHTGFLETIIKNAIGYAPISISIDGHPDIRSTFRTVEDRDNLVEWISAALKPIIEPLVETRVRCEKCNGLIEYIVSPTGEWWSHDVHPDDGHDASPTGRPFSVWLRSDRGAAWWCLADVAVQTYADHIGITMADETGWFYEVRVDGKVLEQ